MHIPSGFPALVMALVYFNPVLAGGQTAAAGSSPADPYAGESFVVEKLENLYSMQADGTGYSQRTVVVKVQSDAAVRQVGIIAIPFASGSQKVEFKYVRVRRPDGSVVETPLTDAIEQPEQVTVQAPFYSDLKQEQLPVKSLRVGDTLEWQARVVRTKPEAPGEFWNQDSFVDDDSIVLAEVIELRIPAGRDVTVWTNPTTGVHPKVTSVKGDEGEQRVYRWESASLKPSVGKEADAAREKKKKTILTAGEVLDADQGKLPSVAWTTFKSWAAVGAWYRGLEGDRMVPDADLKQKVAELTAGKTTDEDKVRAVYAYVSTQVRYVGVAFGVGRYQPHRAEVVLENQYGDCKDKHTLLAAMLGAMGMHADAVLIGAGVRFNEDVPSPSAFNHLITRVNVDGQETWLDTTAEVGPYRVLLQTIRDKQALVIPETGPAVLKRTPAALPFDSFQHWTAVGTLDQEGMSDSKITLELRGDGELIFRAALHQIPPARYDEFMQQVLQAIGYQGKSSHAEIGRPEDTSKPLIMSFDYHREQAGDWPGLRLIPQLAPVALPTVNEKEPPVQPINLETPRTETSIATLKLPEHWTVELPEAVHEKAAFATYDLTYKFTDGVLTTERKIVILQEKIPVEQWKTYKKWQDAVGLGNETYVQLVKNGPGGAGGRRGADGAMPDASFNAEAEKLIQQAAAELKKLDYIAAGKLLDQAKAINPKQRYLWAEYGAVQEALGAPREALKDYQKELELHPDSTLVYPSMAYAQKITGDKDGAEVTMRKWLATDPTDAALQVSMIAALTENGKTKDAVAAADAAMVQLSAEKRDDPAFLMAAGQAYVAGGKETEGAAMLVALLKVTDDVGTMNSVSYSLADANVELPLADATMRTTLQKLGAETQSWTLDVAPTTLLQKSYLVEASWDTMGWILFREGKLQEAEAYVAPASLDSQNPVCAEHLALIREAIAEPAKAAQLETKKTETKPSGESPMISQQLRKVGLGPAGDRKGTAEYRLLISADGVVAQSIGTRTIVGGEEMIQKLPSAQYLPKEWKGKIMRKAIINCYSGKCELFFE